MLNAGDVFTAEQKAELRHKLLEHMLHNGGMHHGAMRHHMHAHGKNAKNIKNYDSSMVQIKLLTRLSYPHQGNMEPGFYCNFI